MLQLDGFEQDEIDLLLFTKSYFNENQQNIAEMILNIHEKVNSMTHNKCKWLFLSNYNEKKNILIKGDIKKTQIHIQFLRNIKISILRYNCKVMFAKSVILYHCNICRFVSLRWVSTYFNSESVCISTVIRML